MCMLHAKILLNYDILVFYISILTRFSIYLNLAMGRTESHGVFYVQMHLVGISWPRHGSLKWKRLLYFSAGWTAKDTARLD